MKKTLIAASMAVLASGAFACNTGTCSSVPSVTSAGSLAAGSGSMTGASAASAGNGSAFSTNIAGSTAGATGFGAVGVTPLNKTGSIGTASVGGLASTGGFVSSLSLTSGNAVAAGSADAAACATVTEAAGYKVTGLNPISGNVSGSAVANTQLSASTSAGVGGGFAVAADAGKTDAGFSALADSRRAGAGINSTGSSSTAGSTSVTSPAIVFATGSAGAGISSYNVGNAGALSNATAGNGCTATTCVNARGN